MENLFLEEKEDKDAKYRVLPSLKRPKILFNRKSSIINKQDEVKDEATAAETSIEDNISISWFYKSNSKDEYLKNIFKKKNPVKSSSSERKKQQKNKCIIL
jgi:hypothetical protein